MTGELFSLALQRVVRKKRSSLLVFFVLLISFSFAILSLSLVGSISETNAQFRLDTYGAWYFAIPSGVEADAQWLQEQDWAEAVGTAYNCGAVSGSIGFGTVDETLREIGRLTIDEGRWPTADNEVVLEMDALSELGYDYTLGQEIKLRIRVPWGNRTVAVERSYILCGILHEYSDLWVLERNYDHRLLVSAVVTQAAAEQVLQAAREQAQDIWEQEEPTRAEMAEDAEAEAEEAPPLPETIAGVPQYFITVPEGLETTYRVSAEFQLKQWLSSESRNGQKIAQEVCKNATAYEQGWTGPQDTYYLYLIAAVTLAAVLCVYLMQLPDELHSLATLRSIGITKPQLALLLLDETLLLGVPAVVLGLPCGAGLTYLALRLVVYAGSISIQVAVPYGELFGVILLWAAAVLFSRLVIFIIAVQMPLTGRLRLQNRGAHRVRLLQNGLLVVLLAVFGAFFIAPWPRSDTFFYTKEFWSSMPSYTLKKLGEEGTISLSEKAAIEQVPNIVRADGFGSLDVGLSFPGMEERTVHFYTLNEEEWPETFDFGVDRDAFQSGEAAALVFPAYAWSEAGDISFEEAGYLLPDGPVTLHIYSSSSQMPAEERELLAEASVSAFVYLLPNKTISRFLELAFPYTVVCSEEGMKRLLAQLPAGTSWGCYPAGAEFGYGNLYVTADPYASGSSTDNTMAALCQQYEIGLGNTRQTYAAHVQESLQSIILLYAASICIALIALLILGGAFSLEAEQEKRSFRTLCAIGMSSRQMWGRVLGKALARGLTAALGGWLLYSVYDIVQTRLDYAERGIEIRFLDTVLREPSHWFVYYFKPQHALLLTAACFAVILIVSLLAKRGLAKGAIEL